MELYNTYKRKLNDEENRGYKLFFTIAGWKKKRQEKKKILDGGHDSLNLYHGGKTGGHGAGTEDHGGNPSADFAWT